MKKRICIFVLLCLSCCALSTTPATAGGKKNDKDIVDLTVLSSTMVYAEVFNMMVKPRNYVGKTVKMRGQFDVFKEKKSGPYYFSCIISDATACCQQGIDFVLSGDLSYPKDYPKRGAVITVTGVFQPYRENSHTYYRLVDATLN